MDTTPANLVFEFDPFPVISSDRLLLRKVQEKDAPEVFFLRSDERVMHHIAKERAKSLEEGLEWIRRIHQMIDDKEAINWAITMKGSDRLLGLTGFWNFRKEHSRTEIGYNLHPDFWGKGIMTEAIGMILPFAFEKIHFHSIDAHVNPDNIGSARALEKNGFVQEGLFRDNYYFGGRFYDTAAYSLINPKAGK